ncbi:MAG: DNA cytosine methyltransferase [Oscillospiraceae bacterium]|nr:DNA cytosine methyltransferase [Oscillospiraceae bacterium]
MTRRDIKRHRKRLYRAYLKSIEIHLHPIADVEAVVHEQTSFLAEIITDNFAGGGGASTGIELAASRPVAIAINHDPAAILLHKTNHPYTEHLQASVWDVDPVQVVKGRPVGLAWFSPDCKHFSKAKGAALVDKKIRGLAWIVLRWAALVRPRVIMLENVEEFQTWGPVRKGKPVKKKAGQTFRQWKQQLEDLGYVIEHQELVAADFGAPTTRKRFALIARCDGQPIVWPERTHAPRDSEEVRSGKCKPWRSAAEIIDWSLPGYSVFATKQEIKERFGVTAVRPLAKNTMRRIIRGVDKFTIRSGAPFIVECNHGGDGHTRSTGEPVNTVTGKYTGGLCQPVMAPWTVTNTTNSVGAPVSDPVHTVTSAGNQILAAANLIQYHTEQSEKVRGQGMTDPIMTVDAANRYGLACANLVEYYGNGNPLDVVEPMHTVTAHDREGLVSAHIQKYFDGGYKGCGDRADNPLSTVTAMPRHGVCAAHMVKFKAQELGTSPVDPLPTITAQSSAGGFAQCCAVLTKASSRENLGHWPEIRALLNEHCGYQLADDEIILLLIRGVAYYIADITLRMLTPRELYNAMGFPADYIIDRDWTGREYKKTDQVARCGNAVCPPMAYAMVWANFPEWRTGRIETMEQFHEAVAV